MKPTVPEVLPLAITYYAKPGNGAGGNLHIVLDDDNIDDEHIQFCLDLCTSESDKDGIELCNKLLRMSKTQRRKVCRLV